MTATEALARALAVKLCNADTPCSEHRTDAEQVLPALSALGYEVRPICQVCTDLHELHSGPKRTLTIEQAAEAVDREAAGNAGPTATGFAASGFATSAAADLWRGHPSPIRDQPAVLLRDTPEAVEELTDIIMAESSPPYGPEDRWVAGHLALRIIAKLRERP